MAAMIVNRMLHRFSVHVTTMPSSSSLSHAQNWSRGIRVVVRNGNLEQALGLMQQKMRSSGMERLIKKHVDGHHIKKSEKKVIARKNLEMRVRSQALARKLRDIIVKKIRGL